ISVIRGQTVHPPNLAASSLPSITATTFSTNTLYDNSDKLFGVKEYADAIENQFLVRDMKWNFNHNLVEIDIVNKIAIFN
ncbi:hypothetical protein ACNO6Z_12620, partial [Aliarcobacter lanthieri]